jgi:hypothetical protein
MKHIVGVILIFYIESFFAFFLERSDFQFASSKSTTIIWSHDSYQDEIITN